MLVSQTPDLAIRFDFAVAVGAVNRPVAARFKGYFRVFAALGTYRRKHLPSGSEAAISEALCFPCIAARGATLRLVGITSGLEELLVLNAVRKGSSTIGTLERFV
jgi:hypothetical protein